MPNESLTLFTDKRTALVIASCAAAAAALAGNNATEMKEARELLDAGTLTQSILLQLGEILNTLLDDDVSVAHLHVEWHKRHTL